MKPEDEIAYLKSRVRELEFQLEFLRTHKTLARGLSGERVIAELTGGRTTIHDEAFDVVTTGGARLEIKAAKANGGRWQLNSIFGETGAKKFDFLILIGEALTQFRLSYRDPESPYVFFLLPHAEVYPFRQGGGRPKKRMIKLGLNPATLRSSSSRDLFSRYQVTVSDLQQRFGLDQVERVEVS